MSGHSGALLQVLLHFHVTTLVRGIVGGVVVVFIVGAAPPAAPSLDFVQPGPESGRLERPSPDVDIVVCRPLLNTVPRTISSRIRIPSSTSIDAASRRGKGRGRGREAGSRARQLRVVMQVDDAVQQDGNLPPVARLLGLRDARRDSRWQAPRPLLRLPAPARRSARAVTPCSSRNSTGSGAAGDGQWRRRIWDP